MHILHVSCSTFGLSRWFYILFLVYPGASSAIFQAFICDRLEDGTPTLRVDYSITCWQVGKRAGPRDSSHCKQVLCRWGSHPAFVAARVRA